MTRRLWLCLYLSFSFSISLPPRFFLDIDFRPNGPEAGSVERARSLSLNNLWYIEPLPENPRPGRGSRGRRGPLCLSLPPFMSRHAAGLVFPFNNRANERREDERPASTVLGKTGRGYARVTRARKGERRKKKRETTATGKEKKRTEKRVSPRLRGRIASRVSPKTRWSEERLPAFVARSRLPRREVGS